MQKLFKSFHLAFDIHILGDRSAVGLHEISESDSDSDGSLPSLLAPLPSPEAIEVPHSDSEVDQAQPEDQAIEVSHSDSEVDQAHPQEQDQCKHRFINPTYFTRDIKVTFTPSVLILATVSV